MAKVIITYQFKDDYQMYNDVRDRIYALHSPGGPLHDKYRDNFDSVSWKIIWSKSPYFIAHIYIYDQCPNPGLISQICESYGGKRV
jgi:hypothetical protein